MPKDKGKANTEKVKLGIVGAGAISQVIHLPILSKMNDVEIVAIADSDKTKVGALAEKYHIPNVFTDFEKLLAMEEIQGVHICTPNSMHAPMAKSALSAGKHVLVEKPIALTYEESKAMVEESKKRKKILMVGMNHRFRPDAMVLKNFVKGKELGKIFYTKSGWLRRRGSWNETDWAKKKNVSGGGVFMDLGIPMLDLSIWLMDNPKVHSVFSTMYSHFQKDGVEDSAAVMIRFENDVVLSIEVSWTLLMENDFMYSNLFGTSGGALLNPLRIHKEMHGNLVNVTPQKMEKPENNYKKSYEYELKHFVECIKNNRPSMSSGEEAMEIMRISEAIYQSAKEKREIVLK
ncbi:Gfo/Idh/MocA family oxidoreductase [bacterium]|nr:Gfo/Idh/MocA family oxidoreductase [bacterium]NUN44191.1 Gfo/Idh/MocA family oxidoreductase [bacterium]